MSTRASDRLTVDGLSVAFGGGALVALLAAIGPGLALWIYGPYPEVFLMPLAVGGVGSLVGFVVGVMVSRHPLHEEIMAIWSRIKLYSV